MVCLICARHCSYRASLGPLSIPATAVRATRARVAGRTGCSCRSRATPTARRHRRCLRRASSTARARPRSRLIVQSNPVPYKPASARHDAGRGWSSRVAEIHARRGHRRDRDPAVRLGLGPLRRRQPLSRHPRPDADLPARTASTPRKLYQVSVHAPPTPTCWASASPPGATSARSSRRARADDTGTPNPVARLRHAQHRARRSRSRATTCAAGCTWASTRTKPAGRCTTACGRSSPAGASR